MRDTAIVRRITRRLQDEHFFYDGLFFGPRADLPVETTGAQTPQNVAVNRTRLDAHTPQIIALEDGPDMAQPALVLVQPLADQP